MQVLNSQPSRPGLLRPILLATMLLVAGFLLLVPSSPALAAATYNVKDCGAVGDGQTDDTQAIQNAINQAAVAGGAVYLPAGTYLVRQQGSSPWALRLLSNVTLFGEGPKSVIMLAPNQDIWTRVLCVTAASNVTLRDFAVNGNDNNQSAWSEQRHGVFVSRSQNVTCSNLTVGNTSGDGIFYYNASSGLVENCQVTGGDILANARVGINFQGAAGLIVRNNSVTGYDFSYKAEIDDGSGDASDIQVLNNQASGGHALALNGSSTGRCRNILVEGNVFSSRPGDYNIWIGRSDDIIIRNNVLTGGYVGIYCIFDAHNVIIDANTFCDQRIGVEISNYLDRGSCENIQVIANTFNEAAAGVRATAACAAVEVAYNNYPAGAPIVGNGELISSLSIHDNASNTQPATPTTASTATTVAPATTSTEFVSTTTTAMSPTTTTTTSPTTAPTTTTTAPPTTTTTAPPTTTTTAAPTTTTTTAFAAPPVTETKVVTLTAPADNSVVRGKVIVRATVRAPSSVTKVRFLVDGRTVATDYRVPYSFTWNTKTLAIGTIHKIQAIAFDRRGVEIGRDSITVKVMMNTARR